MQTDLFMFDPNEKQRHAELSRHKQDRDNLRLNLLNNFIKKKRDEQEERKTAQSKRILHNSKRRH